MRVLGIDTAGPVVGAALLAEDGARSWSARVVQGADARLLPALGALLGQGEGPDEGVWEGEVAAGPVDLVAVSVGPGAFTGLRVGVSAALGVAFALGVPVVALSSLAVRAAMGSAPRVLALLDARKSRVYAGLFDAGAALPVALGPEVDLPPDQVWPAAPFLATGEGAVLHRAAIEAAGGAVLVGAERCPALEVARLGRLLAAEAVDPGEVALRYLRAPDAQPPRDLHAPLGARG